MTDPIDALRPEITELCRRHHVKTLEVFGSAVNGTFDPRRSDLDFLVDFQPMPPSLHAKSYFGLWFALQDLFGRKVDLVETPAVTNPFFLQVIRPGRRVLYAA
jgi:predicted nucleotidyltransferase